MLYHNVGKADRFLRVIVGLALIGAGIVWFPNYILTFLMFVIGIVLIVTGVVGWCAIYSFFNYSSRRSGLNKITRKDIERAVTDYGLNVQSVVSSSKPVSKKTASKKVTKKAVAKKSVKKATSKKVSKKAASKKVTKKVVKKATKKSTKKSTKKVVKKK